MDKKYFLDEDLKKMTKIGKGGYAETFSHPGISWAIKITHDSIDISNTAKIRKLQKTKRPKYLAEILSDVYKIKDGLGSGYGFWVVEKLVEPKRDASMDFVNAIFKKRNEVKPNPYYDAFYPLPKNQWVEQGFKAYKEISKLNCEEIFLDLGCCHNNMIRPKTGQFVLMDFGIYRFRLTPGRIKILRGNP